MKVVSRELNALQLQKTHANRKSTSKSRKHFHQFDSRWCKCSQHKQIKKHTANAHSTTKYILFAARFLLWLCCEHLQRVCCQIDESVFLICRCFFYLQRVELSRLKKKRKKFDPRWLHLVLVARRWSNSNRQEVIMFKIICVCALCLYFRSKLCAWL